MSLADLKLEVPRQETWKTRLGYLFCFLGFAATVLDVYVGATYGGDLSGCGVLAILFLPLTITGLAWTHRAQRERSWAGQSRSKIGVVFQVMGWLVFPLFLLGFQLERKFAEPGFFNVSAAVSSLHNIAVAEEQYRQTYGTYSGGLAELGPGPEYVKCPNGWPSAQHACLIDSVVVTGTKRGYQYTYTAGPIDSQGRVATFQVVARPVQYGRTGSRNFFVDQTGVIRVVHKDRQATANDKPLSY